MTAPLPTESDAESVAEEIPHTKAEEAKAESTDAKMKDEADDEEDEEGEEDEEVSVPLAGSIKEYSDLEYRFIVESIKDHRSDFEDVRELRITIPSVILLLTW